MSDALPIIQPTMAKHCREHHRRRHIQEDVNAWETRIVYSEVLVKRDSQSETRQSYIAYFT